MPFPKESIQLIARVIRKQGWIELPARGTSMYPWIKKGDVCRFVDAEAANIRKGDILLYHTPYGSMVAHRFCRLETGKQDREHRYVCKGDSNLAADEPITRDQLLGKMVWTERNGRIIPATGLVAAIWGRTILAVPLFSLFVRMYLNRRESKLG
ncbi:signal peptidase I [Paenibacillus sp. GCM10023248]|nr:signal peptidase I [Bacillus sp. 3255]MDD9266542.1 signal peptidase I [Paenibacillus sp. MAHUQ-63]MDR6878671.1 signal peptidase [Bacillus sp. 3255]